MAYNNILCVPLRQPGLEKLATRRDALRRVGHEHAVWTQLQQREQEPQDSPGRRFTNIRRRPRRSPSAAVGSIALFAIGGVRAGG